MRIGTFKQDADGFAGTIETLTSGKAQVRISPISKPHDQAPDYRAFRGESEVGAAWAHAAQRAGRCGYLIVTLDDPAFPKPIQARLVKAGDAYALIWDRE